jgi:hypothetical protein
MTPLVGLVCQPLSERSLQEYKNRGANLILSKKMIVRGQQWTVTNSQEDMCIHHAGRRKKHDYFEATIHIA